MSLKNDFLIGPDRSSCIIGTVFGGITVPTLPITRHGKGKLRRTYLLYGYQAPSLTLGHVGAVSLLEADRVLYPCSYLQLNKLAAKTQLRNPSE
jgi:hypothetical protein